MDYRISCYFTGIVECAADGDGREKNLKRAGGE
jgi:hypothetical protein